MLINERNIGNIAIGQNIGLRGLARGVKVSATGTIDNFLLEWASRRPDNLSNQYTSRIYSRLASSMTASQTTITLGSSYLSTGVVILIDSEKVFISSRTTTSNQYNCVRGYNDTTAATHSAGVVCYEIGTFQLFDTKLFLEGQYLGNYDLNSAYLQLREDAPARLNIIPSLASEDISTSLLFTVPAIGSRVYITWTPATDEDIDHQEIYWDEGIVDRTHGDFVLLDTLSADRDWYETVALTDNVVYRFIIKSVDRCDNISQNESFVSATINAPPEGATDLTATWNATTHKVTLSWTASASASDDDFAGYLIFDNWLDNMNLDSQIYLDQHRVFLTGVSYEYPFTLFPGDWIFQVKAVDKQGNQSLDSLSVYLSIDEDFNEREIPPDAPTELSGNCLSGGRVRLTWYGKDIDIAGFTAFYSYDNITYHPINDVIVETPTARRKKYFIVSGLIIEPGTETLCYFKVRSFNSTGRYELNDDYITLTLDDLNPSGPTDVEAVSV